MKKLLLSLFFSITLILSLNAFAEVELNTATQKELETLYGIGPAKAARIIEYRKKYHGFNSVDELEKIDGIGRATLDLIRRDVSVWVPYYKPSD